MTTSPARPEESADFVAFYQAFPRHVGRPAALRAWRTAIKTTEPAVILGGLLAALPELLARDPQYRPHPATWLNQRRWEDPVLVPAGTRNRHLVSSRPGLEPDLAAVLDGTAPPSAASLLRRPAPPALGA